ncbi:MAG: 50S ribosomal protein L11 [Phycisphaeraceae bacterium]|nr:50S ribosomal protein L11 [Phycisphaeraceae bacterium]
MAKEISTQFKIQAKGGQATPAPPIGPALGAHGVNPGQFVTQFNERTRELNGKVVGCVITVYKDRSFSFEIKSPPAAVLLKDAAGVPKGSGVPNKDKVGKLTVAQLREIAAEKGKELTGLSEDAMVKTLAGTARSMGIDIVDLEEAGLL